MKYNFEFVLAVNVTETEVKVFEYLYNRCVS